ncbi:MAG: response regulator transcription factor [Bacillota bacterium]|nr:response regulator transcription factor [Bacillota bacterium]
MTLRVAIADDHPVFRQGLRKVLELGGDVEIVGEARDGEEALSLSRREKPDVLLLDLTMPKISGVEVARLLKEEMPYLAILVLTMHDSEDYLLEAVEAGVDGYVLKDVEPGELKRALRLVQRGERYLHPAVAPKLMTGYHRRARMEKRGPDPLEILSEREWEILQLLVKGFGNKEIGEALFISEKTVKNHATSLFRKLGVQGRSQAILEAIRREWVKVS